MEVCNFCVLVFFPLFPASSGCTYKVVEGSSREYIYFFGCLAEAPSGGASQRRDVAGGNWEHASQAPSSSYSTPSPGSGHGDRTWQLDLKSVQLSLNPLLGHLQETQWDPRGDQGAERVHFGVP